MNSLPYVVEARRRPLVSRTCPDCEGYGEGSLDHPGDPEARVLRCESCCGTGTVEVESQWCVRCMEVPELDGEAYCLDCQHGEAIWLAYLMDHDLDVLDLLEEALPQLSGRLRERVAELLEYEGHHQRIQDVLRRRRA